MCSMCKMDPRDVKVMYQRQGAVEVEDFDEEPRFHKRGAKGYGSAARRRKARQPKTRPGCPGDDYKAHTYVWTTEYESTRDVFYKFYGFFKREREVCVGCSKHRKTRLTEKYERIKARKYAAAYGDEFNVPRGEPVQRWGRGRPYKPSYSYWSWEQDDEGFRAYRKTFTDRYGWNSEDSTNYYGW